MVNPSIRKENGKEKKYDYSSILLGITLRGTYETLENLRALLRGSVDNLLKNLSSQSSGVAALEASLKVVDDAVSLYDAHLTNLEMMLSAAGQGVEDVFDKSRSTLRRAYVTQLKRIKLYEKQAEPSDIRRLHTTLDTFPYLNSELTKITLQRGED
jgi:hypothetical protein